jgi:hypothetical protein
MFKSLISIYLASLFFFIPLFSQEKLLKKAEGVQIKTQLISFLEEVDEKFKDRVERQIASLKVGRDEAVILMDIMELTADKPSALRDILKGAHVRIKDGGFLFTKWEILPEARNRIFSHPSVHGIEQYGVSGPITHEVLFGIIEVDGELMTFFQLENTPWSAGWWNRVGHTMDAVNYLLTNLNIGPYGNSYFVDSAPLMLR